MVGSSRGVGCIVHFTDLVYWWVIVSDGDVHRHRVTNFSQFFCFKKEECNQFIVLIILLGSVQAVLAGCTRVSDTVLIGLGWGCFQHCEYSRSSQIHDVSKNFKFISFATIGQLNILIKFAKHETVSIFIGPRSKKGSVPMFSRRDWTSISPFVDWRVIKTGLRQNVQTSRVTFQQILIFLWEKKMARKFMESNQNSVLIWHDLRWFRGSRSDKVHWA
jgi:hypothetical protein